jgi:hypothetical protein
MPHHGRCWPKRGSLQLVRPTRPRSAASRALGISGTLAPASPSPALTNEAGSGANPVVKVNDTATEAALGCEFEVGVDAVRQCPLAASDDDRGEEQVALIDQA